MKIISLLMLLIFLSSCDHKKKELTLNDIKFDSLIVAPEERRQVFPEVNNKDIVIVEAVPYYQNTVRLYMKDGTVIWRHYSVK